ncbi:MAG TPA: uL15m family ribosomal protein [Thermoplasmata archaeon]|jgi:large subunit ribosomal protein L15|nr:uL15m family ribosomal protein [Thermoplasmata archaeon]
MVSRTRKFRGSRTHGRGKKHGRGHGDRGGTGNAGLHKHKFVWMLKYDPDHFGAHGFVRHHHGLGETFSINVSDVEARLDALVEKGFAARSEAAFDVDLGKAGFHKLLGGGKATHALRITVAVATESAKAKVQGAGGTVTTTEPAE